MISIKNLFKHISHIKIWIFTAKIVSLSQFTFNTCHCKSIDSITKSSYIFSRRFEWYFADNKFFSQEHILLIIR